MATTYKVTGAYVTAAVSGETGSTVLGFTEGATLPSGVSQETIKHLLDVGLIAASGTDEAKQAGPSGQQPQTSSDGTSPTPAAAKEPMAPGSDPADFNVEQVMAHLATADEAERERVLAAEADGKQRKTILEFQPSA